MEIMPAIHSLARGYSYFNRVICHAVFNSAPSSALPADQDSYWAPTDVGWAPEHAFGPGRGSLYFWRRQGNNPSSYLLAYY